MNTPLTSCALALLALIAVPARAEPELAGGELVADGKKLPLLTFDADIVVSGDIATVRLEQTFQNPSAAATTARYLFPLPHDAAVYAMTMTTRLEVVRARIDRVEQARATYAAAKQEGKTAALLEQHRPNVFTQDVANIPAGEEVRIAIEYAESVPRQDGVYELHFPMAVGARYQNGANGIAVPELEKPLPEAAMARGEKAGPAGKRTERRAGVRVRIDAAMPIRALASPSHAIEVDGAGSTRASVFLAEGRVTDTRDFVLRYQLAGEKAGAGLVRHLDKRGEFATLLIEPPAVEPDSDATPRELVFVLDASCSMDGLPLNASKRLVHKMLDALRPNDRFRIIAFGSTVDANAVTPKAPSASELAAARRYLDGLNSMGGTEIELGIRAALEPAPDPERMRMVVFLTDGFIGDEASVMAVIRQGLGASRIFTFGVGNGVNRWLLEEMAVAGRGVARIVGVDENAEAAVDELARRLRTPCLTDVSVDWGGLALSEVTPDPLPDLFYGQPVRVVGKVGAPARYPAGKPVLRGRIKGKWVELPIAMAAPAPAAEASAAAIPVLWARSRIADKTRLLTSPVMQRGPQAGAERERVVEEITQLGLTYAITTQWTAFVAVSERSAASPKRTELAAGAPPPSQPAHSIFPGASTPEPAEWAAMLLLLAMATIALQLRGRRRC